MFLKYLSTMLLEVFRSVTSGNGREIVIITAFALSFSRLQRHEHISLRQDVESIRDAAVFICSQKIIIGQVASAFIFKKQNAYAGMSRRAELTFQFLFLCFKLLGKGNSVYFEYFSLNLMAQKCVTKNRTYRARLRSSDTCAGPPVVTTM